MRRRLVVLLAALGWGAVTLGGAATHGAELGLESAAGQAQTPSTVDTAFAVEAITVEGARRASHATLLSQSLLMEGGSYSEAQLRRALYRIKRLPFVLDVGMRLERGSAPGRYRLVIEIEETSRFFFAYSLESAWVRDGELRFRRPTGSFEEPPEIVGTGSSFEATSDAFDLGARFFLGRNGVLFLSASEIGDLTAGYTRYNVGGSRAFVTGAVSHDFTEDIFELLGDSAVVSLSDDRLSLGAGLPLRGNHSLQVDLTLSDFELRRHTPFFLSGIRRREAAWEAGLRWLWDTTDDPLVPEIGQRYSAGVLRGRESWRLDDGSFRVDTGEAFVEGARYWRLRPRLAWWLSGRLAALERRPDLDIEPSNQFAVADESPFSTELSLGIARALRRGPGGVRLPGRGDLRWESRISWITNDTQSASFGFETRDLIEALTGLVYRNRWAVLRFEIGLRERLDR